MKTQPSDLTEFSSDKDVCENFANHTVDLEPSLNFGIKKYLSTGKIANFLSFGNHDIEKFFCNVLNRISIKTSENFPLALGLVALPDCNQTECPTKHIFYLGKPTPRTLPINEKDYVNCGNIIQYIEEIYKKSLKSTLNTEDIKTELEVKFNIVDVELLFSLTDILDNLNCFYSIAGLIGRFKNTDYGIIGFRGTENINDWVAIDGRSLLTENLRETGLYDLSPNSFKANINKTDETSSIISIIFLKHF